MEINFLIQKSKEPILAPSKYRDTKDPCPVFDGNQWHIFGSGGSSESEVWEILHATGFSIEGPWTEEAPVILLGLGGIHVAAPGVIFDMEEKVFHMFVQTEFMALGGTIEHLVSRDGLEFRRVETILDSIPGTNEAGIYDPHPALVHGKKLITYSACSVAGRPDIHLAESESGGWNGPWKRLGPILRHEEVPHHNQLDQEDYEWGLEGSQLMELSDNWVLLNAVCFLPRGARGTRQRIFFAIAKSVLGPYESLGPVMDPSGEDEWARGENGHAAMVKREDSLDLFYQARGVDNKNMWRYGRATFEAGRLLEALGKAGK